MVERALRSRALIVAGALFTALGLLIAAISPVAGTAGSERTEAETLSGGVIVIVGWALLAWGIHRFGRESDW
jgi:hypothetical protein